MKKNIALAIWFLGMVIVALLLFGCASNKQDEQYDLLYRDGLKNLAYKSITIKDIKGPKEFN